MERSRYITAGTGWKPTDGPPMRTWILTPVSLPEATSGPVTRFLAVSTVKPGPTRLYRKPCSDSGFQSVWNTIGSGQTPLRRSGPPAAAAGTELLLVLVLLPRLVHATATRASVSRQASGAKPRRVRMGLPFSLSRIGAGRPGSGSAGVIGVPADWLCARGSGGWGGELVREHDLQPVLAKLLNHPVCLGVLAGLVKLDAAPRHDRVACADIQPQ